MRHQPLPALKADLIQENLGAEVVVYDPDTARAHMLNPSSAAVFEGCRLELPPGAVAGRLVELGIAAEAAPTVLTYALDRLGRAGLLAEKREGPGRLNRRQLLKNLTVAAGLLPVVASVLTPTPAYAASCIPNANCTTGATCGVPCCVGTGTCGQNPGNTQPCSCRTGAISCTQGCLQ